MAKEKPYDPRRELLAGIKKLAHTKRTHQVFSDLMECSALAIANSWGPLVRDYAPREARYKQIMGTYKTLEERQLLAQLFAHITMALDREGEPTDVLGSLFHELELQNHWKGQFFTPTAVSDFMARMTIQPDFVREHIARRGFFTMMEPTCGAGVMILSAAKALLAEGFNPQKHMHVTAVDIDSLCVHMAYVQASLWHIPAIIVHGNSLTLEEWGTWYTPAHIMGLWDAKLRRARMPVWADLPVGERLRLCHVYGVRADHALSERTPEALKDVALPAL